MGAARDRPSAQSEADQTWHIGQDRHSAGRSYSKRAAPGVQLRRVTEQRQPGAAHRHEEQGSHGARHAAEVEDQRTAQVGPHLQERKAPG